MLRASIPSFLPALSTASTRSMPRRGGFILFEGIDRAGKTTQCKKLVEYLNGVQAVAEPWHFPDRTTILGQAINGYLTSKLSLDDGAIHLAFSANRWEKRPAMLAALAAGTTLVVDRYSYSGMAYTIAKKLPGKDLQWCSMPERGLPAPDIVFYLRVSPEAAATRGGYGDEIYEKAEFQKRVSSSFDSLVASNWIVLDASQPIEDIHAQVVRATKDLLDSDRLLGPVGEMFCSGSSGSTTLGECDGVVHLQLVPNGGPAAKAAVAPAPSAGPGVEL